MKVPRTSRPSYMFKVNNRNISTRCEIYSKLTIRTPERRHCSSVSIVIFEQVNAGWDLLTVSNNCQYAVPLNLYFCSCSKLYQKSRELIGDMAESTFELNLNKPLF